MVKSRILHKVKKLQGRETPQFTHWGGLPRFPQLLDGLMVQMVFLFLQQAEKFNSLKCNVFLPPLSQEFKQPALERGHKNGIWGTAHVGVRTNQLPKLVPMLFPEWVSENCEFCLYDCISFLSYSNSNYYAKAKDMYCETIFFFPLFKDIKNAGSCQIISKEAKFHLSNLCHRILIHCCFNQMNN